MFIGSCGQTENIFFFFLGMGAHLPAQSQANPRTSWRERETDWPNPGQELTYLAGGWAARTME